MRWRVLDRWADPRRRKRASAAARSLTDDPVLREAAARVYFLVEKMCGIRPVDLDLDADVGALIAGTADDGWIWECLEKAPGIPIHREHAIANLRRGSVRHFMQHLCVCRVCRRRLQAGATSAPRED